MPKRPLIAIVGRPNVGKSTLFNRIIGRKKAVVHDLPGMTRDRHYQDAEYRMRQFTLIDTGGYEDSTESTMLQQMRMQSLIAMDQADRVIFLTDLHEPDDPVDLEILEKLRSGQKPFFLTVNKCEGKLGEAQAIADFSRYGLEIYPISALHGDGVYDLMDDVTEDFDSWDPDDYDEQSQGTRIAIVGRQNVGKSSLLNRLLGQERVIANPEGGTTRDAIDAPIRAFGKHYLLIDTAGIRRRGKIEKGPEKLSVYSSFRAIDRCDVAILVVDAKEGVTKQDTHIAGYVLERRKACVLALNKWDLIENREQRFGEMVKELRREFNFMPWAPILTMSAKTGQRTLKIWELVDRCAENHRKEFRTAELNDILKRAQRYLSPPARKGKTLKMKYVTQTGSRPPTLSVFVNDPELLHFSYKRFLTNQFYDHLGLEGTPLILRFRRKAPPRGWEKTAEREAAAGQQRTRPFFAGVYNDIGEEYVQEIDLSEVSEMEDEQFEYYYGDESAEEDED